MTLGTALAAQLMIAEESTWGSAATPTVGLPLVPGETLALTKVELISPGIIAGAMIDRSQQVQQGNSEIGGDITLQLYNKSTGILWKHIFGKVTTTGTGPYTHTFTPASGSASDIAGKGLTIQKGLPNVDYSNPDPFNYSGVKITAAELTWEAGGMVGMKLSVIAKAEDTSSPALQSISYVSGIQPVIATGVTTTIGGSSVNVKKGSLRFTNEYERRFFSGSANTSEPIETGKKAFTGELTLEKGGLTQYARYTGASDVAIVVTFTASAQSFAFTYNARLQPGSTPQVSSMGIIEQPVVFRSIGTTTDASACTMVYTSSESTP